jgi:hypothetical protein
LRVESLDRSRVKQVQFSMGAADQGGEAAPLQLAPNAAPDQAAVAGYINPSVSGNVHAPRNKRVGDRKQAPTAASRC